MTNKTIILLRKQFQNSNINRMNFVYNKKKYNDSIIKNRHQNLYRNLHNRKFHSYIKPQFNDNPNHNPEPNNTIYICILLGSYYFVNKK
jgi:hypothetical protein